MMSTAPVEPGLAAIRLTSARLLLERFEERHIDEEYLGWLNDAQRMRFSNQRFARHTAASARAYRASFAGTPSAFIAICLRSSGRLIGTMTAHVAQPHRTADVGILIGAGAPRGSGFGREAWCMLLEHLLGPLALRKVTAGTLRCNRPMIAVLERSGMHLEAVRRRQELLAGAEEDVLLYARFHPDPSGERP